MEINSVKFVNLSDLLKGLKSAEDEIDAGDLNVTFGDANHTLLTPKQFKAQVLNAIETGNILISENVELADRLTIIEEQDAMIDMES